MVMRSKKILHIAFIVMFALILNSLFVFAAAPVLNLIGGKQIDEGNLLEFTVTASDHDNDTLTFSKNDSRGNLNQNTGQYSWTPSFSESGIYFVQFTVSDGAESASEIIMINVTETGNHAPILDLIGGKQILEGQLLEFTISASDPDSDALIFSTNASLGVLDSAGKFSWQTDFDDAGIYFVLFSVSDASEIKSEIIMVNVTEAGNHAPQISIAEPAGMAVNGNVSMVWSASDIDNDKLEFSAYVAKRIYDNGILMGENRSLACSTALASCVFDSTIFANGNYTVVVTANDSTNVTEGYSNDFTISNSQNQISAQTETQEAQNANSNNNAQIAKGKTSGNGVPPPFWWLINTNTEQGNATSDINEQQQVQEEIKIDLDKNETVQLMPVSKQPSIAKPNPVEQAKPMYLFIGMALLVLIIGSVAYVPYYTLTKDKIKGMQSFVKKKFQNITIKSIILQTKRLM